MQEAMNSIKEYLKENYVSKKELQKILNEEKDLYFTTEGYISFHRLYARLRELMERK